MNFQPLYLMIKPSLACALAIKQLRLLLGANSDYAADRFHITLLPLGDARLFSQAMLARLILALESLPAEPFDVRFDRVHRTVLTGGSNPELRAFQRDLLRLLAFASLPLPDYQFHPHLSFAYGEAQDRSIPVEPIGWRVDEMLLVKSIQGAGRHELLAHFPLEPLQGNLF